MRRGIELSLVGQNLLHDSPPEFTSGQPLLQTFQRSFFVTLTLRRYGRGASQSARCELVRHHRVILRDSTASNARQPPVSIWHVH